MLALASWPLYRRFAAHLLPRLGPTATALVFTALVAALLLENPRAFTIVFTEMAVGATISLFVLLFLYKPYSRLILATARRVTHSQRGFAVFLGAILVVPAVLFLI